MEITIKFDTDKMSAYDIFAAKREIMTFHQNSGFDFYGEIEVKENK